MANWFSALVALESNSPSQEKAWLFKKITASHWQLRQPEKQSRSKSWLG